MTTTTNTTTSTTTGAAAATTASASAGAIRRRTWLAGALGLSAAGRTLAQGFPSRPIKLVVGFAPGGPVDNAARLYAEPLSRILGQQVLVDNRGGAGGTIAMSQVAKAPADGHMLAFAASSSLTMAPWMQKARPFDAVADFTPIGQVTSYANVLLVRSDAPYKSLAELLAAARRQPGKVSYGSAGTGTSGHLAAAFLAQRAGVEFTHVPYRGNAPALNDLMGGQIDFLFDITGTAVGQIEGGRVRALVVTSPQRNAALPDVPTAAEAGIDNFSVVGWFALVGPRGLPADVADKLAGAHAKAVAAPDFVAQMRRGGYDAGNFGAAELLDRMRREQTLWREVIKTAGIQAE